MMATTVKIYYSTSFPLQEAPLPRSWRIWSLPRRNPDGRPLPNSPTTASRLGGQGAVCPVGNPEGASRSDDGSLTSGPNRIDRSSSPADPL